ncbi:MAG TPA: hypothetical protein VJ246_00350 [Patescibacteria group bacterium]|nr:hypothetical protein [Patescibacteria group bacterium]
MQIIEELCQKHGLSFEQYGQEIEAFAHTARRYGGLPIAQAAEAVLHSELSHNFFQTLLGGGPTCHALLAELANSEHKKAKRGRVRITKIHPRGGEVRIDGVYNALSVASTSWYIFISLLERGEDVEKVLQNFPNSVEEQAAYVEAINTRYQVQLPYGI